jgi:tryptophanyl-tRNA synthetase
MKLADAMNDALGPVREKARALRASPDTVRDALEDSGRFCKAVAEDTMAEVREVMGLS